MTTCHSIYERVPYVLGTRSRYGCTRSQPRRRAAAAAAAPAAAAAAARRPPRRHERRTLYMLKAARRAHGALTQVQGYQGAWQTGSTLHPSVCEN
jgi:hypothetical protein